MKNFIVISLPNNSQLAKRLATQLNIEIGSIEVHNFPDGESYIRIKSDVQHKTVILVCGLDHPNHKVLPLMFTAQTIKELGAKKICLISPYLPYMRQDKRFKTGEAITSVLFANFLSTWIDCLITIDPHLHRIQNLSQIYSVNSLFVLHSTKIIAEWIYDNIDFPLIIGPDEESRQWVAEVANITNAPYVITQKTRLGDKEVNVKIPEINEINRTPVLVDDIISTGISMQESIKELISRGFKKPVCIGIHALFDNTTYNNLILTGAQEVITCNTIFHSSNKIDITDIIAEQIKHL